jgi:hypothetical protein
MELPPWYPDGVRLRTNELLWNSSNSRSVAGRKETVSTEVS